MTPIIKREEKDTILTSEINQGHIIVAVIGNKPAIISEIELKDDFRMLSIDNITKGSYFGSHASNLVSLTERYVNNPGCKVAVFHQKDWKKALQWLIDNCE